MLPESGFFGFSSGAGRGPWEVAEGFLKRSRGDVNACPVASRVGVVVRWDGEVADRWFRTYSTGVTQGHNYPVADFTALFDGTELMPPGVVEGRQWHPGWTDLPTLCQRRPKTDPLATVES